MSTSLILKAEGIAGRTIEEVCISMSSVSIKLDVGVALTFNGIELLAFPNTPVTYMINSYHSAIERERLRRNAND